MNHRSTMANGIEIWPTGRRSAPNTNVVPKKIQKKPNHANAVPKKPEMASLRRTALVITVVTPNNHHDPEKDMGESPTSWKLLRIRLLNADCVKDHHQAIRRETNYSQSHDFRTYHASPRAGYRRLFLNHC